MRRPIIRAACAALFVLAAMPAIAAAADGYPSQPIRMIVGFAAGGPTDVIARLLAHDMSQTLGQTVVVENKTGANSLIATREVAGAPPDGYTVLFSSLSHNVNRLLLGEQAGYDPLKDFTPISNGAALPMVAVTAYDSPIQSMKQLIEQARAKPDSISYGSAGNGGSAHLAAAMMGTTAGLEMIHVPFRGNGPALTEVMAGRVSFMFYPIVGVAENVQARRLRVLALGSPESSADFPGVPAMEDLGFPDFQGTWVGLLAPAGVPGEVVQKLNQAMVHALKQPQIQSRMKDLGALPIGDTPQQFHDFLVQDQKRWAAVIKAAGITAQ
ncbi:Bug family tripartite tricarboxylate transporter substrate binding protein [Bordetella petrii]|uniref:Bug family tripartite tricarboxylate transporter substrate binding protein n=1 Tax=Bordetella petrii TaxID=94624 RepID=UPI001E3A8FA1|nr:tripartite tricarboxylate transporter substrate binding protein [Bordetella petrii]MCD0504498.1 tripartite tricarboxylate transporter substrate binding protein [Bordetella petrii]